MAPQRIQMDIPDQFQQIPILFTDDRFIPVLEEMAYPPMPPVEPHGITCEQPAHEPREPRWTAEQKHVNVIVHEGPGNDSRSGRLPCLAHPRKKVLTVFEIGRAHV